MDRLSLDSANVPPENAGLARSLPKRDFFLLPALSILTVIVMLGVSEIGARVAYPLDDHDTCGIYDPVHGARFRKNCQSRVKVPEGPWVRNAYNDCGYRTRESCGVKPSGALRVAVLGSSFSYGYMTAYEDAYTTRASELLSRQCHRPVEFQNLGIPKYNLLEMYRRTDEALALHPDVIMLAMTEVDVRWEVDPVALAHRDEPPSAPQKPAPKGNSDWLKKYIIGPVADSRAMYMLQHFLYKDPNTYLNLFLLYGDNAGFLKTPFTPAWQHRFANLDTVLAGMSQKAHDASVPLVIFLGPHVSQVALVNTAARPGVDPFAFQNEVSRIAAKYGIAVIDPLPEMKGNPDPMGLFYVVDGHLNQSGQQLMSEVVASKLPSVSAPAMAVCGAN